VGGVVGHAPNVIAPPRQAPRKAPPWARLGRMGESMIANARGAALLLALLAFVAGAAPAAALARVKRVVVSTTADESGVTQRLPVGTTVAYVIFDYENAASDKLTVSLEGLGLSTIVAKSSSYTGSGTANVQFTGAELYRALANRVANYADQAQTDVKLAAEQELGRRGYLENVAADVAQVSGVVTILDQMSLTSDAETAIATLNGAVEDIYGLLEEATAANVSDAVQKSKAESMKVPAATLVVAGDRQAETAVSATTMAFPPTGEQASFTVQVAVGNNPSASGEFWVAGTGAGAANVDPTQAAATGPTSRAPSATARSVTGATTAPGNPTTVSAQAARTQTRSSQAGGQGTTVSPRTVGAPSIVPAAGTPSAEASGAATSQVAGQPGGLPGTSGTPAGGAQGQVAAPTWTVPAGSGSASSGAPVAPVTQSSPTTGSGGLDGSDLAVFGMGALLLVGIALWLRGRS
jgi:hypothetical protein